MSIESKIIQAVKTGDAKFILALPDDIDLNLIRDNQGHPLLHLGVLHRQPEALDALLRNGMGQNPDLLDDDNASALGMAAELATCSYLSSRKDPKVLGDYSTMVRIIRILGNAGADPFLSPEGQSSPLEWSRSGLEKGEDNPVEALLLEYSGNQGKWQKARDTRVSEPALATR